MVLDGIRDKLHQAVDQHKYLDASLEVSDKKPWLFRVPGIITSINERVKEQRDFFSQQGTLRSIQRDITTLKNKSLTKERGFFEKLYLRVVKLLTKIDPLGVINTEASALDQEIDSHLITKDSEFWNVKAVDSPKQDEIQDLPIDKKPTPPQIDSRALDKLPDTTTTLRLDPRRFALFLFLHREIPFEQFLLNTGKIETPPLAPSNSKVFVVQDQVEIDTKNEWGGFLSELHIHAGKVTIKGQVDNESLIQLLLRSKGVKELDLSDAVGLSADVLGVFGKLDGLEKVYLPEKILEPNIPIEEIPTVRRQAFVTTDSSAKRSELSIVIHPRITKQQLQLIAKVIRSATADLSGAENLALKDINSIHIADQSFIWKVKRGSFPNERLTPELPLGSRTISFGVKGVDHAELGKLGEGVDTLKVWLRDISSLKQLPQAVNKFLIRNFFNENTERIARLDLKDIREEDIRANDRFFVENESVTIQADTVPKGFLNRLNIRATTLKINGNVDTKSLIQLLLRSEYIEELDLSGIADKAISTDILGVIDHMPKLKLLQLPKKMEREQLQVPDIQAKGILTKAKKQFLSRDESAPIEGVKIFLHRDTTEGTEDKITEIINFGRASHIKNQLSQ